METSEKFQGTVRTYIPEKGYGFIRPEDGGKDIFFHIRAVHEGKDLFPSRDMPEQTNPGFRVEYEVGKDRDNRPRALRVKVLQ